MFNKMKIKYKILMIPVASVIGVIAAILYINLGLDRNQKILVDIVDGNIPAWKTSQDLMGDITSMQSLFDAGLMMRDASKLDNADKIFQDFQTRIEEQEGNQAIDWKKITVIKEQMQTYYPSTRKMYERLIQRGRRDTLSTEYQNAQWQYRTIYDQIYTVGMNDMKNIQDSISVSQSVNKKMSNVIYLSLFVILPFMFVIAFLIIFSITKPLHIVIDIADKVSNGNFQVEVPHIKQKDEVGILLEKFRKLVTNNRNLAVQIKEAANALAAASSEISASVTQIASGATETATAANETSTTVEEVRQTALDSNRKAKYVSEASQKAVQISQKGEKAVVEMVEGMKRIEAQMSSIAESIMKLSEHGQAIGGIIATVEDVAEQSNLLAVNASIEAAKAGEQGKGFAVVAMEVKSLAEQSRQATSRVRSILDDIQKATGSAVLTTEQGGSAVESGVQVSANASDAIQRLANSVAEAAQATTQIAVSSQEQLVGMDQVVSAMESIKQASTQNVTATKQVESAAHDLHELGQNLKHLTEQYKV
jgi:methyl-accepting chemotaxis protein